MALRSETGTARTLIFDVPGWPGHQAGQHVDVRLTAPDGYSAQRAYSISAPTDGDLVSLTVQRVGDGEVSPYLVEGMELGDELEVRGPDRRLVRLGAQRRGTGRAAGPARRRRLGRRTPDGDGPRSARASAARHRSGSSTPCATPARCCTPRELARRAGDDGLQVDLLYTRAAPEDSGRPAGRITGDDLGTPDGWSGQPKPRAYVCGPTGFVEHVIGRLLELGYTNRTIRAERFGPSGD